VDLQKHIPELSSIRLNKKLFNNRLTNRPEDLKGLVRGARDDIDEITTLLRQMGRYRAQFSDMKTLIKQNSTAYNVGGNAAVVPVEVSEGKLGRVPENTESIANLMLFDSDVNVYGEQNVDIPEFDYKSRKMVNIPKGKKFQRDYLA
jgi:hypothetical protein